MSEVANKLRKAALGWKGGPGLAMEGDKQLFDCVGESHIILLRTIADEIEAEQGECKEVDGVTESFDVPRDCEFVPVHPFHTQCTSKEQACKVLEEAAEVFGAWQRVDDADRNCTFYEEGNWHLPDLADEIADVIQAACNLAYRYGIDVSAAMQRCEQRNRERGRYA
jgi:NTP pyrophosphatase (non-canonical NTP hydrolase)